MRRLGLAVAGVVALLALVPATAGAHATLESTTPARGASLHEPPAQIVLHFNEAVEGNFGAIRVFDGRGERVDAGNAFHPDGEGSDLAVKVKPGLKDGTYTATYRIVSADSHPIAGGYTFSIGHGGATSATVDELLADDAGSGSVTATAFGAARAVQYAAIALALGTLIFAAVAWLPALRELAGGGGRWQAASAAFAGRARRLLLVAGGAGLLSGAAGLVLQGATASGSTFWSALDADVLGDVLDTRFGTVSGLGVLAWAAVLGLAAAPRGPLPVLRPASVGATGLALPAAPRLVAFAAPLALLAALPALGGHAGTQDPRVVMLGTNIVHVLAMGAWLGGIAVLVLALRGATARLELHDRTRLLAAAVARFSALAGIAVAALLASGILQSIVAMTAVDDLVDTAFGRAVLIKGCLFVALVTLGWMNRRRLIPGLRRAAAGGESPGRAGVLLRRTLRGEAALGVAVLAVTGALATYAPPDARSSGPFSTSETLGPARIEATVDPARVGRNLMHVYLFSRADGRQYDAAKEFTISASLPSKDIGPIELRARKGGPGHYVVDAASFGAAGDWTVEVVARVSEFDEYRTRLEVPIK